MRDPKLLQGWDITDPTKLQQFIDMYGLPAFGDYNTAPNIFKPITAAELASNTHLHGWCTVARCSRQLHRANDGTKFDRMIPVVFELNNLGGVTAWNLTTGKKKSGTMK